MRTKLARGPDYGIWQAYQDSLPLGEPVDLYSEKVEPGRWVDFGTIRCERGEKLLQLRCQGRNGWSSGYVLGLDQLELVHVR